MALAADRAGHRVVGLVPGPSGVCAPSLARFSLAHAAIPASDLLILGVPDDAIGAVVATLAGVDTGVVCHLSGFTSSEALGPLRSGGRSVGALHPVQSLPDPEQGAAALRGSFAAVSGDQPAKELLNEFARSLGMVPFEIEDAMRAIHHAAAVAASNFVAAALVVSRRLAEKAGVPVEAYEGLTSRTIANVAAGGIDALTGPIARGDMGTVRGQLAAIAREAPDLLAPYVALVKATASLTTHRESIESAVEAYE